MHFPKTRLGVACLVFALVAGGCATDAAETSTSTEAAPLPTLVLAEDGLGDVLIGFPPEVVLADISALFGSPDLDSGWIPSEPNIYGSCPGRFMRAVGWGSLVTIFVNDGIDPLGERFFTYTYGYDYAENVGGVDPRGLNLSTDEGITVGSTVADLHSAYGARLLVTGDTALDVWSFDIDGSALRGLVNGPDQMHTVTLIELTPSCG